MIFQKLLYAVRRVKFETILKYYEWYLCQISRTNLAIIFYTTTRKRFLIFTCRYFKLSWNTTALSLSNRKNFSCIIIIVVVKNKNLLLTTKPTIKTYLQLISLMKKKTVRSKHYLQVISFHRLLFFWISKNSIQLTKFISVKTISFHLKTNHFDRKIIVTRIKT